jgi:hypothetical protein
MGVDPLDDLAVLGALDNPDDALHSFRNGTLVHQFLGHADSLRPQAGRISATVRE